MLINYYLNNFNEVQQEDFIKFYKNYFDQDLNEFQNFLSALESIGISNIEIYFYLEEPQSSFSFSLYIIEQDSINFFDDSSIFFTFYKDNDNKIRITLGSCDLQLDLSIWLQRINIINNFLISYNHDTKQP